MSSLEGQPMYTSLLIILCVIFVGVKLAQPKQSSSVTTSNASFHSFQSQFVLVYLIMMMADWLQGPTVYKLYEYYHFTKQENALLFVAGFGSSMIFGTFAGTLADKYGRKLCCQIYGVTYAICCLTKHVNNYYVLMFGRVLGGFSTSILWSAFESWMVSEHTSRGFNSNLISGTFSMMIQRNGLVAIAAGFIAELAVNMYAGHPVAPFDASLLFLIGGTVYISVNWTENYGDRSSSQSEGLARATQQIFEDKKVLLIGIIQSLYEGAMYVFVFGWSPLLLEFKEDISFGFAFASFMISCSLGAVVFEYLKTTGEPETYMPSVFGCASACMLGAVFASSPLLAMICFCGFEVTVGIFWPAIMSMRSKYLPENGRATIMNLFRIPLNAIVCLVLFNQGALTTSQNFLVCSGIHFLCVFLTMQLQVLSSKAAKDEPATTKIELTP